MAGEDGAPPHNGRLLEYRVTAVETLAKALDLAFKELKDDLLYKGSVISRLGSIETRLATIESRLESRQTENRMGWRQVGILLLSVTLGIAASYIRFGA